MLSRRNVRIKAIQLLYSVSRDEEITRDELKKRYWKSIDTSYELFLYNLYTIYQITRIAEEDKEKRQAKFIQTDEDKTFTAKIYHNPRIKDLESNNNIQKVFDKYHFDSKSDKDLFRNIYYEFSKSEAYINYLAKQTTDEDDLEILLELFRFCRNNQNYDEIIEDRYITWEDDKTLVAGAIKKVLKALPIGKSDFYKEYYPDDETVKVFGETLLLQTFDNDTTLQSYITPVLKNWSQDRLAVIDMIMMKLAVSEFVYFDSVPTKVTLNEYVELSKLYSTSKSKDFINGVLDTLVKQLTENGTIMKSGRGLVDE